jgi:hypothetical protein
MDALIEESSKTIKERPFTCLECRKTFIEKNKLKRHADIAHLKIRHECLWCQNKYTRCTTLKNHLKLSKKCADKQQKFDEDLKILKDIADSEIESRDFSDRMATTSTSTQEPIPEATVPTPGPSGNPMPTNLEELQMPVNVPTQGKILTKKSHTPHIFF